MIKGELREQIMSNCPEDFEDELKDFIDKLECFMADIVSELSIESIADIGCIEEAHSLADDLCDSLY